MPLDLTRRDFFIGLTGFAAANALLTEAQAEPPSAPAVRRTILIIGAHYDDCEIGAGGLIVKAVKRGHRVVLLNVVGDYSTWWVTKGREKRIREENDAIARELGVEKRYLGFGYQQVTENLDTLKQIAQVVADVKPDITLFPNPDERERAPADHGIVGKLAEQAVRHADTILGGLQLTYGKEMYAYEIDPQRVFPADTFIDIGDVIVPVVNTINRFRKLNAELPAASKVGETVATTTLFPSGDQLQLTTWGEIKLCTARIRGLQSGPRFAEAYRSMDERALGGPLLPQIVK